MQSVGPFTSPGLQPLPPARPTEASPLAPGSEQVLVLSTHAKVSRYVSTLMATLFLLGFHVSLAAIGLGNAEVPCERPLAGFLVVAGAVGACGTLLFVSLELRRSRDEALLLPSEARRPPADSHKLLVVLTVFAALLLTALGAAALPNAPECAHTSPIVYNWTLATLLLYGCFGALVVLVPILSAAFPLVALILMPVIAVLVALANWLAEVRAHAPARTSPEAASAHGAAGQG
jgi:hypothetical protein